MKGLPKRFATADDIRHCKAMADAGEVSKSELLEMLEDLEKQNYICCPIRNVSADGMTVTVGYCSEAEIGNEAVVDGRIVTIESVTHIGGENNEDYDDGIGMSYEETELVLSAKASSDAEEIDIRAPYSIFDSLGITEQEFNEIKEDLKR